MRSMECELYYVEAAEYFRCREKKAVEHVGEDTFEHVQLSQWSAYCAYDKCFARVLHRPAEVEVQTVRTRLDSRKMTLYFHGCSDNQHWVKGPSQIRSGCAVRTIRIYLKKMHNEPNASGDMIRRIRSWSIPCQGSTRLGMLVIFYFYEKWHLSSFFPSPFRFVLSCISKKAAVCSTISLFQSSCFHSFFLFFHRVTRRDKFR